MRRTGRLAVPPDRPPRRPAAAGLGCRGERRSVARAAPRPRASRSPSRAPTASGSSAIGLTWALLRPDRFVFACGGPRGRPRRSARVAAVRRTPSAWRWRHDRRPRSDGPRRPPRRRRPRRAGRRGAGARPPPRPRSCRCPRCTPTCSSPATLRAGPRRRRAAAAAHRRTGPTRTCARPRRIDAAVAAGVQRIVKISGGAPTLGPNGTTPTAVAHWRSEQRIERSGLDFAFLRPSFYMQNLLDTVAPRRRGERHARGAVRARPDRDGRRPRRRGLRDRRAAGRAHHPARVAAHRPAPGARSARSPSIWASATSTCR